MDAHAFATGLRQIADWYEVHPDIPLPHEKEISVYGEPETEERAAEIIQALGQSVEKGPLGDNGLFVILRKFNGVSLRFVFDRAAFCTAHIIGTRVVREYYAPEHTVNIVKWDCPPILTDEPGQ